MSVEIKQKEPSDQPTDVWEKDTTNVGEPWSEAEIIKITALVLDPVNKTRPPPSFTMIASTLKRTSLCVQQKVVELLDERNKNLERKEQDAYDSLRIFLLEPIEGMAVSVSAHDLVFHLGYSLTGSPELDRYLNKKTLDQMIEAGFSIFDIQNEVNATVGANVVDDFSIALRLACLKPDSGFALFEEDESLVYSDIPLKEIAAMFEEVNFGFLRFKTWVLSEFISDELAVNDLGGEQGYIVDLRIPLKTAHNYFYHQAYSKRFAPKKWNAIDSLILKQGVLRGDSLFNLSQQTQRTPLSLLFQLIQRPMLVDSNPVEGSRNDVDDLIDRIALTDPETPIKHIATAQNLSDLASSVLIVRDDPYYDEQ